MWMAGWTLVGSGRIGGQGVVGGMGVGLEGGMVEAVVVVKNPGPRPSSLAVEARSGRAWWVLP